MELRWDGVRSLADAMAMLKRQVAITPPPQWVRVVGGFADADFTVLAEMPEQVKPPTNVLRRKQ
jgi:predicted amidohydrolase YtcJ